MPQDRGIISDNGGTLEVNFLKRKKFDFSNPFYNMLSHFLGRLDYWTKRGKYGIEKDGLIWIYNSLESWAKQLGISKNSVRRAIKHLKEKGIIESAYLASNKRNRTLFYAINYEKLADSELGCELNPKEREHPCEHMYIRNSNSNNNKSINQKRLLTSISERDMVRDYEIQAFKQI